ncbi:alpha/beta fold hydrolase [Streptosporangium sp. NPDC002607]
MWEHRFLALSARHRVIRYDWRGYGESGDAADGFAHHEDLLAVLDALGVERPALRRTAARSTGEGAAGRDRGAHAGGQRTRGRAADPGRVRPAGRRHRGGTPAGPAPDGSPTTTGAAGGDDLRAGGVPWRASSARRTAGPG